MSDETSRPDCPDPPGVETKIGRPLTPEEASNNESYAVAHREQVDQRQLDLEAQVKAVNQIAAQCYAVASGDIPATEEEALGKVAEESLTKAVIFAKRVLGYALRVLRRGEGNGGSQDEAAGE